MILRHSTNIIATEYNGDCITPKLTLINKKYTMKINLGAGHNQIDGFVSVDYDSKSNPDYCLNIETDDLPFEDSSVEAVVAHHILEHLGEGYFHVLQELYRVCKHGAIIDIRVPHPRHEAFFADPTHRRPITPMGLQLFSKKFNQHCREINAAASLLGEYFDVDFEILDWRYIPEDKYSNAFKDKPAEFIEEYISERNNIVKEFHIRLTVIKE
jgi:SAM-dependent methyltransferase